MKKLLEKLVKDFQYQFGITHSDTKENADYLAKKLCKLRVFEDENGKMNKSIKEIDGELLIISQFTLYAETKDGNRPSFIEAARPEIAEPLYDYFIEKCKEYSIKVEKGIFGAEMKVDLLNDGPVTIIIESK